ncbi:TIGR03960 family B12-binding radical SAM protein [bacterium]|nr:TIGR03960 family B12-binding radical SAM protein [bacterium]
MNIKKRKKNEAEWSKIIEEQILPFVERPSRYINHEFNSSHKNWDDAVLHIVLIFPDAYEIGISHLGLKILYSILNKIPGVIAERCYSPWVDAEKILREKNIPLCSLESSKPINEFDIIGFSIQYELSYTNILAVLDLAGIPIRSDNRWGKNYPLVIAGGNVYSPGPLEPFIDAFALGDGEETIKKIAEWAIKKINEKSFVPDKKLMADLAKNVPGIYAPALYETIISNDPAQRLCAVKSSCNDIPFPVPKQFAENISNIPVADVAIVPYCEAIHDRAQIEIMRGCVRGCRFCQAGMVTRPLREKKPDKVIEEASSIIKNTGYDEISLTSLSSGDYSNIADVLKTLRNNNLFPNAPVAVALPSLRIDSYASVLADTSEKVRKTSFTFAPEAGSERLRKVINKQLSNQEIVNTIQSIIDLGWSRVKAYFMIGLPTETFEDIKEMVQLVQQLLALKKDGKNSSLQINVSIAAFIPKSFTPFQWAEFSSINDLIEKRNYIYKYLPKKRVKISFHKFQLSKLEAVFARGDRKLADVAEYAFKAGCRFDQWTEQLDVDKWDRAFADAGINPDDYLKEIPPESLLPWDVLDYGVSKEFLLKESNKALETEETPSCLDGKCVQCGLQKWNACSIK